MIFLDFPLSETWICILSRGHKLMVSDLTTRDCEYCWWFLLTADQHWFKKCLVLNRQHAITYPMITRPVYRQTYASPGSINLAISMSKYSDSKKNNLSAIYICIIYKHQRSSSWHKCIDDQTKSLMGCLCIHVLFAYSWHKTLSMHSVDLTQCSAVHCSTIDECRDHFVYASSQWETNFHCNVIFHWLGAYT